MVRHDLGEGLRDGVVDDEVLLPVEDVAQHVRDDRVPAGAAVVHHLRDERADGRALLDGHFRQPVGEDPVRHGQREERPGDLEQLQPRVPLADLLADTLRSHSATPSGTPCASGIHRATANGKTSSRTFS